MKKENKICEKVVCQKCFKNIAITDAISVNEIGDGNAVCPSCNDEVR